MGYLDDKTQKEYYQGLNHGSYQFCSLEDIINQFVAVYVGEDKMISRAKRVDVAFHAQRALAEMSFDTLKSVKSQQIDLPPSLTMILPHDYVNYTKLSWTDGAGIKHRLYPTRHTSNPFQIRQNDDGTYDYPESFELVVNGDYSLPLANSPWVTSHNNTANGAGLSINNNALEFIDVAQTSFGVTSGHGFARAAWQELDVSQSEFVDISGIGTSVAAGTTHPGSTLRLGVSTTPGDNAILAYGAVTGNPNHPISRNFGTDIFNLQTAAGVSSFLEWTAGETGEKELRLIDVSALDTIYVIITSHTAFTSSAAPNHELVTQTMDSVSVLNSYSATSLQPKLGNETESSTWQSYKASTPSENNNNYDYDYDDEYRFNTNTGRRYGLDPQHAQVNGSFYIDDFRGKIHFSSNVSGKTVILDYISDSLGTDEEMQVHKFAEDAMYKYILCEMLSTRRGVPFGILRQSKKDKFAAVRKAKIRLSNFKIEELTQILRGKSKHIKH